MVAGTHRVFKEVELNINEELIGSIIGELESFVQVPMKFGWVIKGIREFGEYQENGFKFTKEDLKAVVYYAGLAILCRDINESLSELHQKDSDLFKDVISSVHEDEQKKWGTSAFPYDDREFPFKYWFAELPELETLTADPARSLSLIRSVGEYNLVHEWSVKPGKRLYIQFLDKFGRKFKDSICKGANSPYDLFQKNIEPSTIHQKCVIVSLTAITDSSPALIWYPIAGFIGFILAKTGLKAYCES